MTQSNFPFGWPLWLTQSMTRPLVDLTDLVDANLSDLLDIRIQTASRGTTRNRAIEGKITKWGECKKSDARSNSHAFRAQYAGGACAAGWAFDDNPPSSALARWSGEYDDNEPSWRPGDRTTA